MLGCAIISPQWLVQSVLNPFKHVRKVMSRTQAPLEDILKSFGVQLQYNYEGI